DDLVINDGVIQSKDLNKSEKLSSKVEEVLRSMESMRVVNMARDEQIDKILESVSRIEIMISQLNDEDDLIELDKRSFIHDDAFKIEINMDNPVSPTIRAATKKKNISKGKTTMGIQKKLPFNPQAELESQRLSPNHPINPREELMILELAALRCTDDQSDVSFKTTWQLPPRFELNVLEQVIKSNFYKDDGIQEYNKQFHDYKITKPEDIPQCSSSLNSATWVMKWMDMTFEFKPNGNNK
ncbi:hypothetical protein S245_048170, partial [Arachis hypogaea]